MKRRKRTTEPKPMTPEQRRLNELATIAGQRRIEHLKTHPSLRISNGLWFPDEFLPDDLKEEYRMLYAAVMRRGAAC